MKKSFAQSLDISGDGKSDIVIGAPLANDVGEVYVFYSDSIQPLLNGSDLSTALADDILSDGSAGDEFGYSAAIGGDINGDGYSDILVGSPYADDEVATNNGKVYIYFGGPPSLRNNTPDIVIKGSESNDLFGFAVSPAGDVNNDGFDDIIVGAPYKYKNGYPYFEMAYIFYGGPSLWSKPGYPNISANDADVSLRGETILDGFGSAVSSAGDFNGDGYDDVIVGASMALVGGNTMGRAYIYYGGPLMDSTADITVTAGANLDQLGSSVARGGDLNGDGYGDVLIGAPYADAVPGSGDDSGKAYIIYGGAAVNSEIDLGSTNASLTTLTGFADFGFFGTSVGYAGDVNNDGFSDIVVGGRYLGNDPSFKGRAYVYWGGSLPDATPDVTLIGENKDDRFGTAVAGIGDVDGDGHDDILVGAYLSDGSGTDNGRVYLYPGDSLASGDVKSTGDARASFTGGVSNGWAGYSVFRPLPVKAGP